MLGRIVTALKWSFSIGKKFFRVVPGMTLLVIMATLISQVSALLAFLLPLKVLMLLGSPGIPRYFPDFFGDFNRDALVVTLSISAVLFYLLYLVSENLASYFSSKGARLLLARNRKIVLFENQEEVASRGYQRFSRGVAACVFVLIASFVIGVFFYELVWVLLFYIFSCVVVVSFLFEKNEWLRSEIESAPNKLVNILSSFGFLLSFGFIVTRFLFGSPPSLLVALLSLILLRQSFSRVTVLVNDLIGLYGQRLKLNALFFQSHVLVRERKDFEKGFWHLLEPSRKEQWLYQLLEERMGCSGANYKVITFWCQLGLQDIAAIKVDVESPEGDKISFLIKIFNKNKSSVAKHEATLLAGALNIPSFNFLEAGVVEGYRCNIFSWRECRKVSRRNAKFANMKILEQSFSVEPDESLIELFRRSRPPFWQNINESMFSHLRAVATMMGKPSVENVDHLRKSMGSIVSRLKNLPLVVVNKDVGSESFYKATGGRYFSAHWGRWSLEPVGATWPTHPKLLPKLSEALSNAAVHRHSLSRVQENDAIMTALLFDFEKLYGKHRFSQAIDLIPHILDCLES